MTGKRRREPFHSGQSHTIIRTAAGYICTCYLYGLDISMARSADIAEVQASARSANGYPDSFLDAIELLSHITLHD